MEIIFMRHGKAQEREEGLPDAERRLTPKGCNRVRAAARALACGFVALHNLYIWASPLVRARETAAIMAAVLQVEDVTVHPAIATGDLAELLAAIKELPDNAVVIVVGHEPYLGMWVTEMTQAVVPFKTATVAAVKVTSLEPPAGRLRWFAYSGVLADIAEANC